MVKMRRRRRSIAFFVLFALLFGVGVGIAGAVGRPEAVRQLAATATIDADGRATVTETIDYHFQSSRHGIYRVLPDVPVTAASQVHVSADTYDDTLITPEGAGMRIRIGNPSHKIDGNHTYRISYPLDTLSLGGGQFGWDGVGTAWVVPIDHAELDMVAPWKWESPSCSSGSEGEFGDCTVTQPEPGHLVVSAGPFGKREGLTIYAKRGAALAATPAPRVLPAFSEPPLPWWRQPLNLGVIAALLALVGALVVGKLLRRAGRDWVVAGAVDSGDAAGVAFSGPGAANRSGVVRVDDTELDRYATTEFAPPGGLAAWQGGLVAEETVADGQRVAWLLEAAVDGYIELDDADPKAAVIRPLPHAPDDTTSLLAVGFAGRSSIELGSYDPAFTAMWSSLPAKFKSWFGASGFADETAEHRARVARPFALVVGILAVAAALGGAALSYGHPLLGVSLMVLGALVTGPALAALVRGWELRVRTPAGSAVWLRVESFRRFLAGSETHHVEEAAARGVLRQYTAWAVALDEVEHWSKMVNAAGLPPETSGLHSAMIAPALVSSFVSTGTTPSSSGGGGAGGGGGGGGGGSW